MTTRAADSFDDIRARKQIQADEVQMCPQSGGSRTLRYCLRAASRYCSDSCPYAGDWIGPQPD